MPYRRRRRYPARRSSRRYYSGLGRYKRRRSYYGMRVEKQRGAGLTYKANTRRLTIRKQPFLLPDQMRVNFTYSDLSGTNQVNAAPYYLVTSFSLNGINNILRTAASQGNVILSATGVREWGQFYRKFEVLAVTVRATLLTGQDDRIGYKFVLCPREADADMVGVSEMDGQQISRSMFVGSSTEGNVYPLIYQTSMNVLAGSTRRNEDDYTGIMPSGTGIGVEPDKTWLMDVAVWNYQEDGGADPYRVNLDVTYHTMLKERRDITTGRYTVPGPEDGSGVELTDDARMSAVSSTISGFSDLMAARALMSKGRR